MRSGEETTARDRNSNRKGWFAERMSKPAKEKQDTDSSFLEKLSTLIVDKRNLVFLIVIILLVFSAFSRNWVEVESDLTYYLPEGSGTANRAGIPFLC